MVHTHLGLKAHEMDSCCCDHGSTKSRQLGVSLAFLGTLAGGILVLNSKIAQISWLGGLYGGSTEQNEIIAMIGAVLLGLPIIIHAVRGILQGHMHMDELVALAVIAAFANGEYVEAGVVAFIMLIAELLETRTALGARASIESLIRLTPTTAMLVDADGTERQVDVSALKPGDIVRVRPGDNIPADGEVQKGLSTVNEATITGESLPVDKVVGMQVFAGTSNLTGVLDIVVTKAGSDTTLGKVQQLIIAAEQTQLPIMRIIDRYIKWYIPTILMIAAIVYFFTKTLDKSIGILVISCPCALIMATPTAMVAALSAAARLGILIKNVSLLEIAGKITAVVFDKTGTLTTGQLYVTKLEPAPDVEPVQMLMLAASAEQMSKHPAARAVINLAREANVSFPQAQTFEEAPGKGVRAVVEGRTVLVGRDSFLKENGIDISNVSDPSLHEEQGFSTLYMAADGKCVGWIGLQDKARPEAQQAVKELFEECSVRRVTMLTGDRSEVANRVSAELGCTDFKAHCLPQDKLAVVEAIRREGHLVAVVGDGINDAPALAAGDLGIAMGAAGSDVAINSASIALMSNDLRRLPFLVQLSRKTRTVINQNLFFGILFIVFGIIAITVGWVSLIMAAVLHLFGALAVIFNSARLVRFGEHLEPHTQQV
ncbi:MAG TPA: cation-translocating P-type ATPase [Anaerohalosphaeraceae bacterium]|nr:cation-translocating P-type ATPase [Anaerohalosphaeraceae bacterium]HOM75042.1 cation-translocating P-type ATPase [Anaerohalosphaeraceae bacterium]HPC63620.1 cation-translocating P-type ATPase [Anaerohalosphaeraceae bacterium]HPO68874.1 cation-translocating P-type ATPase [Anaerohalosphaeraceae bacterium]HRS71198.1 cation-translocating P-type ATPase [Anaerohalosphaeraceae bacterium]